MALAIRCGAFFADTNVPAATLSRVVAVLDLLYHCSPLHTLVLKAEHLSPDTQGSDQVRPSPSLSSPAHCLRSAPSSLSCAACSSR